MRTRAMTSSTRVFCLRGHVPWRLALTASLLMYVASLLLFSSRCYSSRSLSISHALNILIRRNESSAASLSMQTTEASSSNLQIGNPSAMKNGFSGDLRKLSGPWNRLCFGNPKDQLRIALFVKKWPAGGIPGGMERHALTLHKTLAERGHIVHVYTVSGDGSRPPDTIKGSLSVHFFNHTPSGGYDYAVAWEAFLRHNATQPFDIVHTESVGLPHWKAKDVDKVAASWHGIAYEVVQSEIAQDLTRKPGEGRSAQMERALRERLGRVIEEIKFFQSYKHHIATSDSVNNVLQTIYQLPVERVHTILTGVSESTFYPSEEMGQAFRDRYGVPRNASLVLGAAGRLVNDKGHPLLFAAMRRLLAEDQGVFLLVAGKGPWEERYKELAPNVVMVGSLTPPQLAQFYNAIDIFLNPTLRAQGLDLTMLEAMQCGTPLLVTNFNSITWSVIVSNSLGYTSPPNADALYEALLSVRNDGRAVLRQKGTECRMHASLMFTAGHMASSYERLFLCMRNQSYCHYPLAFDCPPAVSAPIPFF
ncbi:hypothetical protein KP509_08G032300 [Ceratopteris richardii]|uniref:Glycosyltransferase subfamily 4-like N-terminal domain-containing protein n=1 Tax=Ceratopteris richardii TaxID=49495 RepID=A0A8T2U4N2_CERRI|nr:hypothetical protein KP509_08G032300 [Ceratopteris richardii]